MPQGNWKIVSTADGFQGGNLKDFKKTPYGNSILVQNTDTGEKLRYSHLSDVGVSPGDVVGGGSMIGKTGATGNVSGAHLDLEYYTPKGQIADVMMTPYGGYYTGGAQISPTAILPKIDLNKNSLTNTIMQLFNKTSPKNEDAIYSADYFSNFK